MAAAASRALVWVAGIGGLLLLGRAADTERFDPLGRTEPFGEVGNLLVAPAARWDSVWFLTIAQSGYEDPARAAFFPLYPLLTAAAGVILGSPLLGGVAVSSLALVAALAVMHRLAALELGPAYAGAAVALTAAFPAAVVGSAVYSESLYLALSLGAVWSARTGRWWTAGALGALAAGTRSVGLLLVVPLALLYLYGPRDDRPSSARGRAAPAGEHAGTSGWAVRVVDALRPRHPVAADAGALVLVPAGLLVYLAYLGVATGDSLAPFSAQEVWMREFAGPFAGAVDGAVAAWDGARQLLSGSREPVLFQRAGGDPFVVGARNLGLFGFLVFGLVAAAGVVRRLPAAYGAYVVCALALPLSYPVPPQPLMSLPRFLWVLFPLHLVVARWAVDRRLLAPVVAVWAVGLVVYSALFASWRFVA